MANTVSIHVRSIDETNQGFEKVQERLGKSMAALVGIAAMAGPAMSAPLVAGAGASTAALASVGAAVGAFGLAVSPQIAKIADLKANLNTMSPSVRAAAVQFRGLTGDLNTWSDSLAPKTMPVFTNGLKAMRAVLPQLTPLVETASGALTKFTGSLLKGVQSGGFKSFISDINTSAKVTLPAFLNSLKNIGAGFGGIIRAFLPFSGAMTGGLERITARFREFGRSLSGSAGFQKWMEGVQAKIPVLLELFTNLGQTALKLSSAFMPFSEIMLAVVASAAKLVNAIPQGAWDFLVPLIASIVVGMKVWAVATGIVTAAQAALGIVLLTNPYLAVAAATVVLGTALYSLADASGAANKAITVNGKTYANLAMTSEGASEGIKNAAEQIGVTTDELKKGMPELANYQGQVKLTGEALGAVAGASAGVSSKIDDVTRVAARAAVQTGEFTDSLKTLANQQLAMSGSLIGLEASFDAASDAVRKNGHTLDIHTEKGRGNRTALNNIAAAALGVRDKMTEAGESGDAVAKRMNGARENFVRLATHMGMSSAKARQLANDLGLIRNKRVSVSVISKSAEAAIGRVHRGIASLHDKRVFIDTVHRVFNAATSGQSRGMNAHGGVVGHYGTAASGGVRGNMTWVGEQGPELVDLAPGSTVHSAGDSRRMMANMGGQGGGGAPMVIQLTLGTTALGEVILDPLRKAIWTRGGNVQATLGRA